MRSSASTLSVLLLALHLLAGCASEPVIPPGYHLGHLGPAEGYVCEQEETVSLPTARAILDAVGLQKATTQRGGWPGISVHGLPPAAAGVLEKIPDPLHPLRKALGMDYRPGYYQVRECNALIIIHRGGLPTILPLDPDKPILWPDEFTGERDRAYGEFRQRLGRDLQGVPLPKPEKPPEPNIDEPDLPDPGVIQP